MKNRFYYIPVLLVLISCQPDAKVKEATQVKAEEPATEVIRAQKGKLSSTVRIPGELIPYHEVDIYAKENSFVKKVYVDVGSEVKEGQLLASLDAPELGSRLLEAQSRLKGQEAIYTAAKASHDRLVETSKTPGTISPNDLDQAVARKSAEFSQLQALRSAYSAVAQTRDYLEIRAPFSGVISSRNVASGAYVGPGQGAAAPLFVLQQQNKLRLVVSVPEAYAGLLRAQNDVYFTIKSMPDQKFTAKITRLAGALDSRLRAERIEMDVENKGKKLLAGAYAEVSLPLPSGDSAFVVLKTAVVTSTEKTFVIRVAEGRAAWVDVKKGREAEGKVEVYSDSLTAGDALIKVATDEIRNGSEIKKVTAGN